MRKLVRKARLDPRVRALALEIVSQAGVSAKDFTGEVRAIFEFAQSHIHYTQDIHDCETLQAPLWTIEIGAGDCDDATVVICALLASIGHATKIVAIGTQKRNEFEHVYAETLIGRNWVPLDATEDKPFGWGPPRSQVKARMEIYNGS